MNYLVLFSWRKKYLRNCLVLSEWEKLMECMYKMVKYKISIRFDCNIMEFMNPAVVQRTLNSHLMGLSILIIFNF